MPNYIWENEEGYPQASSQPEEEGILGWGGRQLARTGSRALETAIGMPKNIMDIGEFIYQNSPNFISEQTQKEIYPSEEQLQPIKKVYEYGKSFIPSSEDVKESLGGLVRPGYLEPQNTIESSADSFTETLTSLLVPVFGGGMKIGKAIKVAGSGNIAGEALKALGVGETGQQIGKSLTMLATSMGLGPSFKTNADKIYNGAGSLLKSENESMSGGRLRKILNAEKKNYIGNEVLKDWAEEISKEIKGGRISLNQLWRVKKKFPQYIEKAARVSKENAFEVERFRDKITHLLKNESPNKEFANAISTADELYSAAMKSKNATDWIKDTISTHPKQLAALGTIGGGIGLGLGYNLINNPGNFIEKGVPLALFSGVIGTGMFGRGLFESLKNSKTARSVFKDMMEAAVNENKGAFIKNASKLQKIEKQQRNKSVEVTQDDTQYNWES